MSVIAPACVNPLDKVPTYIFGNVTFSELAVRRMKYFRRDRRRFLLFIPPLPDPTYHIQTPTLLDRDHLAAPTLALPATAK